MNDPMAAYMAHRRSISEPVSLTDIRVPIFAVGTERNHVAPWRSTYKINLQTETEVTYLLTTGGHNVGIVSDLGYAGRRGFRVRKHGPEDHYLDPDRFLIDASQKEGSWWPELASWLESSPAPCPRRLKWAHRKRVFPRLETRLELTCSSSRL